MDTTIQVMSRKRLPLICISEALRGLTSSLPYVLNAASTLCVVPLMDTISHNDLHKPLAVMSQILINQFLPVDLMRWLSDLF
jgi:hypothetical protein